MFQICIGRPFVTMPEQTETISKKPEEEEEQAGSGTDSEEEDDDSIPGLEETSGTQVDS